MPSFYLCFLVEEPLKYSREQPGGYWKEKGKQTPPKLMLLSISILTALITFSVRVTCSGCWPHLSLSCLISNSSGKPIWEGVGSKRGLGLKEPWSSSELNPALTTLSLGSLVSAEGDCMCRLDTERWCLLCYLLKKPKRWGKPSLN